MGINLSKEMKDMHTENHKIFMKKPKKQINGNIVCVHGLEEYFLNVHTSKAID